MRFCDLAKLLKQYYEYKIKIGDFVPILIDAILDEKSYQRPTEINPIYGLSKSAKEAMYSGRMKISQDNAAILHSHIDELQFAEFISNFSLDAQDHIRDQLAEFGFDVPTLEVGKALANILGQIIRLRAKGMDDNVTTLTYKRIENAQLLKNIVPSTIERRKDKLHIAGEVITIYDLSAPDDIQFHEFAYISALYDVYAERLKKTSFTIEDIPTLPKVLAENFKDQRMAYYSAISIERSIRDVFDDGESEFEIIKDDAWEGINITYYKDYNNGYERLLAVLEKITNTTLDKSVLSQIRNLIGNLEKKGICHILVNDGKIPSWVSIGE